MKTLLRWFDKLVYWLFWKSINRIIRRKPYLAYMFELEMRRFRHSQPVDTKMIANMQAVFIISHEVDDIPRRFDVRVFEHPSTDTRYFLFPDGKVFWFKMGECFLKDKNIISDLKSKEITT